MANVKDAARIAKFKYPTEKHTVKFISSIKTAATVPLVMTLSMHV